MDASLHGAAVDTTLVWCWVSNQRRNWSGDNVEVGSLMGRSPPKGYRGAWVLQNGWKPFEESKAEGSEPPTGGAGTKVEQ